MILAAQIIIAGAIGFLVVIGGIGLVAPSAAFRFWRGFGSSLWANSLEACLRFLIGVAVIVDRESFPKPDWAMIAGAFLALSALAIGLLYPLHKRFAAMVVPPLERFMRPYSLGAILLGLAVAWFWRPAL
ncbi:hypothetical protein HK107_13550 [Parvularcula sp. ZS-1/3]|uniref:Uncharacterized protein n=1 Tax=Parvularcula mediterranea TaxID=2732508 RepID=A0A7Y3RPJ3_9PROT|nr:hypothetical protein [Parvularcula mediterranea]NNU17351.1 hypothetical protein [Parvularcula mediterranea]